MSEYSSSDYEDFPLTPSSLSVPLHTSSSSATSDSVFDWFDLDSSPSKLDAQCDHIKFTLDAMLADLDCRPLIVRSAFTDDALFGLSSNIHQQHSLTHHLQADASFHPSVFSVRPEDSEQHSTLAGFESQSTPATVSMANIMVPSPTAATAANSAGSNSGSPVIDVEAQIAEIRRRTSDETLAQHAARSAKNQTRLPATLKRKKAQIFSNADRQISTTTPATPEHSQQHQQLQMPPLTPASSASSSSVGYLDYQQQQQQMYHSSASPHGNLNASNSSPVTPVSLYNHHQNMFPMSSPSPSQLSSPPAPMQQFAPPPTHISTSASSTPAASHFFFSQPTTAFHLQQPMMQTPPHLQHHNMNHFNPQQQQQRAIKPLPAKRPKSPSAPRSKSFGPTTPNQLSFVNYTSEDAHRLSAAVAPSGNGKRKAAQLLQSAAMNSGVPMQLSLSSPAKKAKKAL